MTTNIDQYFLNGCMRCKYGGTLNCKVNKWHSHLEILQQIVLKTELKEEMKWGVPVYTLNSKNVLSINALKDSANISFFKGVTLKDTYMILQQQGNVQSERIIKFTELKKIIELKDILIQYILEAIEIEKSGLKVILKKNPESILDELNIEFKEDPIFENAFKSLTLGKQRGYIIHFSQPKQTQTRINRIKKYKEQIFKGIGINNK